MCMYVCVCVCVCVCLREYGVGVGEPPFNRPWCTEHLYTLIAIHMLPSLHLTFDVHTMSYVLYMMTVIIQQIDIKIQHKT